jgi:hypothetical protein
MADRSSWLSIPGLLGSISPIAAGTPGMEGSFSASNVPLAPGLKAGYDMMKIAQGTPQSGQMGKYSVTAEPLGLTAGQEYMKFGDISESAPFLEFIGGNDKLKTKLKRRFGDSQMLPSQWEAELNLPQGSISGYRQDNGNFYGGNVNMNVPLSSGLLAERSVGYENPEKLGSAGLSAGLNVNPYSRPDLNLMFNYMKKF